VLDPWSDAADALRFSPTAVDLGFFRRTEPFSGGTSCQRVGASIRGSNSLSVSPLVVTGLGMMLLGVLVFETTSNEIAVTMIGSLMVSVAPINNCQSNEFSP
jgi:hypothetical protein